MGASKYWPRRKTSKAEKGNQRNKSRNVKGNSSGTSSASTHLRASDGSCVDVCTCKKGHFSPVKSWKPERTNSSSDTQKHLGSEAPFEKLKNSIIQLKPSLNVRTKSSQKDIKGSTPALKNTSSAVKLRPSLDPNRSPEPPGITKSEIPLLSKKFQVINRYPSDIRIFKYNESVISSPNSSPVSTGQLAVGSPFLSPTSSISLYSTRRPDSSSTKPFESGVVSPFRRKFSTGELFSAAQNHKTGKVESKKSKVFSSSSPLSKSELNFDIDETKNLIVDNAVAKQQRLDSMQTNIQSDSPPSIYPMSPPRVKLIDDNDQREILYVSDAENKMSEEPMQIGFESKISPSTSSLSVRTMSLTPDNDQVRILHVNDAAGHDEILERVQNDAHSPIHSPASLLSKSRMQLTLDENQTRELHFNDPTTDDDDELLGSMKIYGHNQVSSSITSLPQSERKHTNDNDQTKIFCKTSTNKMLESIQTVGQSQNSTSISPLSKLSMKSNHDKDSIKNLQDDATSENGLLESMQISVHAQISPSTSPLSQSATEFTHDDDHAKILYVVDDAPKNEMLKPIQTDGYIQTSVSSSPLSQYVMRSTHENELTHDNDQKQNFQVNDITVDNEMSKTMQTGGYSQISSSTSVLSKSDMKLIDVASNNDILDDVQTDGDIHNSLSTFNWSPQRMTPTHYNKMRKILSMNDERAENEVFKLVQTDSHSQIPSSTSPLSKPVVTLIHDNDKTRFLHLNGAKTGSDMLEYEKIDDYNHIFSPTSPLFQSTATLPRDNNQSKIMNVNDTTTENKILKPIQIDGHNRISPSTSPFSKLIIKIPSEKELARNPKVDVEITNKVLEPIQTDDHMQVSSSTFPLSLSNEKYNYDYDQEKDFFTVDSVSKNEMLKLEKIDDHDYNLSSSSSLSQYGVALARENDEMIISHMNDVATENYMLEPVQTDGHDNKSSPISSVSQSNVKFTHDNDHVKILHENVGETKKEMLESMKIIDHSQISPSTSPVSKSFIKHTCNTNPIRNSYMDDVTMANEVWKPIRNDYEILQESSSTSQSSRSYENFTHDNDQTKFFYMVDMPSKNEMLESMQNDDYNEIFISPSSLSRPGVTRAHNCDEKQISHMNGMIIEKERLELMQSNCHDDNREQILHVNDAKIEKERLKLMQNDDHGQNFPSIPELSKPALKITHEKDRTKSWHVDNIMVETDILEPVQIDDHSQISPSISSLVQTKTNMQYTHDNDRTKILQSLNATIENDVSALVQTHDHSQISQHSSPLSQSTVKLTHDTDQTKILHVVDASTTNDMLEPNDHSQISASSSPLSVSSIELTHDDDHVKILHMIEIPENEMLESDQIDSHIQFSHSTSHAADDESPKSECINIENGEFYKNIDIRIIKDLEHIGIYDSEDTQYAEVTNDINLENVDFVNINKIDTSIDMHNRNPKKDNQYTSEDRDDMSKFKREKMVDLQNGNNVPEKPKFGWEKMVENDNGTKIFVENRRLQNREITDNINVTSHNSTYIDNYYSEDTDYVGGETDGFKTGSIDVVDISRVDTLKDKHYQNDRNNKQVPSKEDHLAVKRKFRRDKTVKLESENEVSDILELGQGRVANDENGTETFEGGIIFKKREIGGNTNIAKYDSGYIDGYYSEDSVYGYPKNEIVEFNSENDDFVNVRTVKIKGKHHRHIKRGKTINFEEYCPAYKCKFRRGRILDMQTRDDIPRWLNFNRGRAIENDTKTYVDKTRLKKREIGDNTNTTSPDSEYTESYYSEDFEYTQSEREFNPQNGDATSINKADMLQVKNRKNSRNGRQFNLQEDGPAYKCNFRRRRIVDPQNDNDVSRRLEFRRVRGTENDGDTETYARRRRFKNNEIVDNVSTTGTDSEKVILRHQEIHEKKDELCLFNDVIEETVTMLSKSRKSKVKTLVGAFETIISLQDKSLARIVPH